MLKGCILEINAGEIVTIIGSNVVNQPIKSFGF